MSAELILRVESLKEMLVLRATGGAPDNTQYKENRRQLVAVKRIKKHLPECVLTCRDLSEFWGFIKLKFATYAERKEFLRVEFEKLLNSLESDSGAPCDSAISALIQKDGLDYVHEVWRKALERRSSDPEGAITSARSLLEAVCKHILDSNNVAYKSATILPKLYELTTQQLNLSPNQHTDELFKKILGGCQNVVEGLGSLRNELSDAHGKGRSPNRPATRHAELAVNLSGTMALFLLQTFASKRK